MGRVPIRSGRETWLVDAAATPCSAGTVLQPGPMEDLVPQTATAEHSHQAVTNAAVIVAGMQATGRERTGVPVALTASPRDPGLTRRHHVDLLRTASAVCRPCFAG